jgi:hypothetical protein
MVIMITTICTIIFILHIIIIIIITHISWRVEGRGEHAHQAQVAHVGLLQVTIVIIITTTTTIIFIIIIIIIIIITATHISWRVERPGQHAHEPPVAHVGLLQVTIHLSSLSMLLVVIIVLLMMMMMIIIIIIITVTHISWRVERPGEHAHKAQVAHVCLLQVTIHQPLQHRPQHLPATHAGRVLSRRGAIGGRGAKGRGCA